MNRADQIYQIVLPQVSGQYCFQRRLKSREILTTLQQQRPFLYSIVQDIFKATEVLFATIFLSIVLAIAGIKAMLNKRAGKNVCLAASFAPCFFSLLTVLLTLYHFFTPRVLQPGFSLLLLSGILVRIFISNFCCLFWLRLSLHRPLCPSWRGHCRLFFPRLTGGKAAAANGGFCCSPFQVAAACRSRQFMLIGAQALEEMPDLLTFIIVTVAGIGVTVVWNIWICASLLTMGRAVPQPLVVDSHGETYMGIVASFTRTPGQGLACLVVLVTFVLQFESGEKSRRSRCLSWQSAAEFNLKCVNEKFDLHKTWFFRIFWKSENLFAAIVFTKFLTTRCVKKWWVDFKCFSLNWFKKAICFRFEKLPRNGVRSPRCDYVLPVCMDVPKDWGPMGAASSSLCLILM